MFLIDYVVRMILTCVYITYYERYIIGIVCIVLYCVCVNSVLCAYCALAISGAKGQKSKIYAKPADT